MLWIPSTNTARVTHENAFQLCAQKKVNQVSVSDFFKDCEPKYLFPEDPKLLLQLTHLLSVSYFSASQGVFLRPWTGLLSIYGPGIFWTLTGDPLQSYRGECTDHRPSWQKVTLEWSSKLRNGHSDTKYIDKWFQQYTYSDPGLKPDSDTIPAARAGSAFDVLTEEWSFAPYDLAYSREIFYKKIQFYCIVNIIWQLQVKESSLIALNETKHSQIHTYTHGEKIHHVLLQLWRKQHRNYVWIGDLTRRCSVCSHPKPSPAEHVLLTIVVLFLKNPSSSNFEILCIAT